jgi:hypothetical protein
MFDDVQCHAPLPDGRMPPRSWFQTKNLYGCVAPAVMASR